MNVPSSAWIAGTALLIAAGAVVGTGPAPRVLANPPACSAEVADAVSHAPAESYITTESGAVAVADGKLSEEATLIDELEAMQDDFEPMSTCASGWDTLADDIADKVV